MVGANGSDLGVLESSFRFRVPAVSPGASCAPESSKFCAATWLVQPSYASAQSSNGDANVMVARLASAHASGWALAAAGSSASTNSVAAVANT